MNAHSGYATALRFAGWLLVAVLVAVQVWLYLPGSRSFPYSDEWNYLPALGLGPADFVRWLFVQHVDHRIPLQKLLHLGLLKAAGYDVRVLIGFNLLVSAAMALALMRAARRYRGEAAVGDLFIPLCLLNPAAGHAQWGFEFQFLTSVAFTSAFLLGTIEYFRSGRPSMLRLAVIALFLCAWCGMNGVILSTILAAALLALGLVMDRKTDRIALAMAAATLAVDLALIATWTASPASSAGALTAASVGRFVQGMINAPLIVYAYPDTGLKAAALGALLVSGLALGSWRIARRRPVDRMTLALLATLVAALALVGAVASGRARGEGWSAGLEMHYGVLAMILPTTAWIVVSGNLGRRVRTLIGLLLIALFAAAYQANHAWRSGYLADVQGAFAAAAAAIAGSAPPLEVAGQHITQYFFVDNDEARAAVADGIVLLRQLRDNDR